MKVDVERAHELKRDLTLSEEMLLHKIKKETGLDTQIWAARSIAKVFEKLNLPYERTVKTNAPSFTKNFLSSHEHPLVRTIAEARELNKAHTTFIDTIIRYQHRDRIHAGINQIRSDNGGTVTGRFSYSNPNLQQIPARNKDLGPLIRSLFVPEEGCEWGCFDYNQQEPRLVVHYASLDQDASVFNVKNAYAEVMQISIPLLLRWLTYLEYKLKQLILDYSMEWVKQNFKLNSAYQKKKRKNFFLFTMLEFLLLKV